jgi:hypothetical protein
VGFIVIAAFLVGGLGFLLSVLLWVRPRPPVGIGALALGFLGCGLAIAIPFLPLTAVADIPDQARVTILCGSLHAPQTDFSAYQYVAEDSSDPKLRGTGAGVGPGADPQRSCQHTLSNARRGAIGGGGLAALALLVAVAHGYRRPGRARDGQAAEAGSGSEAPDAEISI